MPPTPISFVRKLGFITEHWSPKIIAQMNDCHFKLARIHGDFVWHAHPETDEVFIVIEGRLRIDFRDGSATLNAGEMIVVPKGMEHKPYAEEQCCILLVEPAGTVNTGDAGGEMTTPSDIWI